ncbi:MAG: ATP-binding protein [bacterium]
MKGSIKELSNNLIDSLKSELKYAWEEITLLYELDEDHIQKDPDTICRFILDKTMRILQASKGFIILFDGVEKVFVKGIKKERIKSQGIRAGNGIIGRVIQNGSPIIINNKLELVEDAFLKTANLKVSSLLSVPLKVHDRVIGVMGIFDKALGEDFKVREQRLAFSIATQAAFAIEDVELNAKLNEELKKTKKQLIHSERLSLIGELSANVSHEVKNPLVIISINAKELIKKFSKDAPAIEHLNRIERQAKKAMMIIEGLLTFAREFPLEIKSVNVNDIIENSLILVEGQMTSSNIKLNKKLNPSLPDIQADPRQLEQVCLNIILNAIQSMPDGGELTISTLKNKKFIQIVFADTGCGILEENYNKIFEPFFTTKGEGSTGLGLAISHRIIKNHKGDIEFNSKVGEGTTFTIKLPLERR